MCMEHQIQSLQVYAFAHIYMRISCPVCEYAKMLENMRIAVLNPTSKIIKHVHRKRVVAAK